MIGDKGIIGTIIGISELNVYESCKTCWCRVEDESFCKKCNQKVDTNKEDFNLVMYVQDNAEDEEKLDIFSFKSMLGLSDIDKMQINEDNLNEKMNGHKCVAQYKIEKNNDAEKLRLVKLNMIST